MKRTLIVDDKKEVYDRISGHFENPTYAGTVEEGLKEIASGDYDLVVSDYHLSDDAPKGGLEIIRAANARGLDSILMSKENHRKEAEELGTTFIFKKELLESENINELLMGDNGRK
jgi:CheY-like chemotaxis protein